MDRGGRTRMAAREGNQVFLGAFGRAQPVAKGRDGALFEGNHLPHAAILTATGLIIRPIGRNSADVWTCAQIFWPSLPNP